MARRALADEAEFRARELNPFAGQLEARKERRGEARRGVMRRNEARRGQATTLRKQIGCCDAKKR